MQADTETKSDMDSDMESMIDSEIVRYWRTLRTKLFFFQKVTGDPDMSITFVTKKHSYNIKLHSIDKQTNENEVIDT